MLELSLVISGRTVRRDGGRGRQGGIDITTPGLLLSHWLSGSKTLVKEETQDLIIKYNHQVWFDRASTLLLSPSSSVLCDPVTPAGPALASNSPTNYQIICPGMFCNYRHWACAALIMARCN